jgi:hypothetical protein
MSNQIATIDKAAERRSQLAYGGRGVELSSFEDAFRFAAAVASSGLAPASFKTPEQILIAVQFGAELGLMPMQALQSIAVVNNRPTLWGDAIPALLWANGFAIEEEPIESGWRCTIIRPTGQRIARTFTEADAKAAGLLSKPGPWSQYRSRMLQMRARAFAARDGAADVLRGLKVQEEMIDVTPARQQRDDTAAGPDPLLAVFEAEFAEPETTAALFPARPAYDAPPSSSGAPPSGHSLPDGGGSSIDFAGLADAADVAHDRGAGDWRAFLEVLTDEQRQYVKAHAAARREEGVWS